MAKQISKSVKGPKHVRDGLETRVEGLHLVTCCTSTRTTPPKVRCSEMGTGLTMSQALEKWLEMLSANEADITPSQLYRGVGFHTVTKIADLIGSKNVSVVTGGQGLLKLDTKIVPYDFTSNKNHPGNMLEVVTDEPFVIPLWWNMINGALRGSSTPIADIMGSDDVRIVVVALNKFFMKYLHDDMLATEHVDKLRIIVVGKSRGSIPTQLRQQVLQVDRGAVAGTVGNRNDISHRAALLFIRKIVSGEVRVEATVEEHQEALGTLSADTKHLTQMTPHDVLSKSPDLLELADVETAFQEAKRRYGTFGGIIAFRAMWYTTRGVDQNKSLISAKSDAGAAKSALDAIRDTLSSRAAKNTGLDSDKVWELARVFVGLIKREMPEAKFNASDFQSWMESYCKAAKNEAKSPRGIDNLHKVSQFLAGSHSALGLIKLKSSTGGSVLYGLK